MESSSSEHKQKISFSVNIDPCSEALQSGEIAAGIVAPPPTPENANVVEKYGTSIGPVLFSSLTTVQETRLAVDVAQATRLAADVAEEAVSSVHAVDKNIIPSLKHG